MLTQHSLLFILSLHNLVWPFPCLTCSFWPIHHVLFVIFDVKFWAGRDRFELNLCFYWGKEVLLWVLRFGLKDLGHVFTRFLFRIGRTLLLLLYLWCIFEFLHKIWLELFWFFLHFLLTSLRWFAYTFRSFWSGTSRCRLFRVLKTRLGLVGSY